MFTGLSDKVIKGLSNKSYSYQQATPSNSPYSYDLCKYFMNKQGYKIDLF